MKKSQGSVVWNFLSSVGLCSSSSLQHGTVFFSTERQGKHWLTLKIIQVNEPADQGLSSPNGHLWKSSCLKLLLKAPSQASPGKIGFYII